jgi:hypothetical protein
LKQLRRSIERRNHVTVWREMQRQHQTDANLRALFEEVPETLAWR